MEDEKVVLGPAGNCLFASYMSSPPLRKPLSDEEMEKAIEDGVADEYLEEERRSHFWRL
jgi:hypothetical protein